MAPLCAVLATLCEFLIILKENVFLLLVRINHLLFKNDLLTSIERVDCSL